MINNAYNRKFLLPRRSTREKEAVYSRSVFAPVFRSYRRLVAQHGEGKGLDEGRRDGLHESLCHRVGGCRERRQSEAGRRHECGIHDLPQVWNGE
jgi:hypothetical protein